MRVAEMPPPRVIPRDGLRVEQPYAISAPIALAAEFAVRVLSSGVSMLSCFLAIVKKTKYFLHLNHDIAFPSPTYTKACLSSPVVGTPL